MSRSLAPLLSILITSLVLASCDTKSSKPSPALEISKQPLPASVMRAMVASGEPCIRRFRGTMPETYIGHAYVSQSREGFLVLVFHAGDKPEFDACIGEAIRTAKIPVQLAGTFEVPLAFDFKN